jgi:hypothetical protein
MKSITYGEKRAIDISTLIKHKSLSGAFVAAACACLLLTSATTKSAKSKQKAKRSAGSL